jgi:microcompartment protein CcmK/EutM
MIDEGNSGRQILKDPSAPIKSLIVGFVDAVEVHGKLTYDHRQTQQP